MSSKRLLSLSLAAAATLVGGGTAMASGSKAPDMPNALPKSELLSMRPADDNWYEGIPSDEASETALEKKIAYDVQTLLELAASTDTVQGHKQNLVNFIKTSVLATLPLPKDPLEETSGMQLDPTWQALMRYANDGTAPVNYPAYWQQIVKLDGMHIQNGHAVVGRTPIDRNFTQALLELSVDTFDAVAPLKTGSCRYVRAPLLLANLLKIRISAASVGPWGMDCKLFARHARMMKTLEAAYESSYGNMAFASCGEPYFLDFSLFDGLVGLNTDRYSRITYSSYTERASIGLSGAPGYNAMISYQRAYNMGSQTFADSEIAEQCGGRR